MFAARSNSRLLSRRNSQNAKGTASTANIGTRVQKVPPATPSCAMTPALPPAIQPPASSAVMPAQTRPAINRPCVRASRFVAACQLFTSSDVRGTHMCCGIVYPDFQLVHVLTFTSADTVAIDLFASGLQTRYSEGDCENQKPAHKNWKDAFGKPALGPVRMKRVDGRCECWRVAFEETRSKSERH